MAKNFSFHFIRADKFNSQKQRKHLDKKKEENRTSFVIKCLNFFLFIYLTNILVNQWKNDSFTLFHFIFIFFLSYSPLIVTPLWGPYPIRVILFLDQVHPSQLLRHRLSVKADDVMVAVLVCRVAQ